MQSNRKKYALFIGRWQPFHNGHKFLVDQAMARGDDVCVAVRDTEVSGADPFTAEERCEMIQRVYRERVKVIVIPDIKSINIGRNVGYDVNVVEAPADIARISGTRVRAGEDQSVPPEVAAYIRQRRMTLWLTGLPCSGKTTLARPIKEELERRGLRVVHLDADDIRKGLNADLGFSPQDRVENLRRAAEVCRLLNANGNFVIASFVSPLNEYRRMVREIIGNFTLVYVKCSPAACEARDVKGMYRLAREGKIRDFTGVSAPFEDPPDADIVVDTERMSLEACVRGVMDNFLFRQEGAGQIK